MLKVCGAVVVAGTMLLAGCASSNSGSKFAAQDGSTCRAQQSEIAKLAGRGIGGKIDLVQRGKKVSAQTRAEVDRYNSLLESYMGSGCHKV